MSAPRVPTGARWIRPITHRDGAFVFHEATSVKRDGEKAAFCRHVVRELHRAGVVLIGVAANDSYGLAALMNADCDTELGEVHVTREGWDLLLALTWSPREEPCLP